MTDEIIVAGLNAITDCKIKVGTVIPINGLMNDAVMECKLSGATAAPVAADAAAPAAAAVAQEAAAAPPAPAADANPSDLELITKAQTVIEKLKAINCKKQKRDMVGLMMIKKIMDAMETCKDAMVNDADQEDEPEAPAAPAAAAAA